MDFVLGTYANEAIESMSKTHLDLFEELMEVPDPEMFKWLSGTVGVPPNWNNELVRQIRSFHLNK